MYENPSQRKSNAEAVSVGRFASVRKKMLVCRERAGDLRIIRMDSRRIVTSDNVHAKRRERKAKKTVMATSAAMKAKN